MHDCHKTKEDLIDLVFNEMEAESELRVLEELERCAVCRHELRSMREALQAFDETAPAALPQGPEYWLEYRATLDEKLSREINASHTARVLPFWRRAFTTSFNVPVPAAIAATLLLAVTSLLAVRSLMSPASARPSTQASAVEQIQIIEKPVEKIVYVDRIVPRTVYVPRREREATTRRPLVPSIQNIPDMTAQTQKGEANPSGATLNGFQPTSDVKLKVIKGSYKDEK